MPPSRLKRFLAGAATYTIIIGVTLVLTDLACMALGILPPPQNPGHATLGWLPARATGRMELGRCYDVETRGNIEFQRNEDAIRTSLSKDSAALPGIRIAVVGDSHTDLCSSNEEMHSGVLESELARGGIKSYALSYGVGRYSPVQQYLAFREVLRPYGPRVLVMNFYTGNDLYDILRVDDRPHFAPDGEGYRIAPPVWYTLDDPARPRRSRVLALFRTIGDRTGIRTAFQRFSYLRRIAAREDASLADDVAYMQDLVAAREPSLGYPDALTAQMLNQQLFFKHFPASRAESLRRVRALLKLAREENPGMLLVLSAIPSYQLVGETPVDSALIRATGRLPVSLAESIASEQESYDALRRIAVEEGWLFVDNLTALRAYGGPGRLYNDFDYHLLRVASGIVGRAQGEVLLGPMRELTRRETR